MDRSDSHPPLYPLLNVEPSIRFRTLKNEENDYSSGVERPYRIRIVNNYSNQHGGRTAVTGSLNNNSNNNNNTGNANVNSNSNANANANSSANISANTSTSTNNSDNNTSSSTEDNNESGSAMLLVQNGINNRTPAQATVADRFIASGFARSSNSRKRNIDDQRLNISTLRLNADENIKNEILNNTIPTPVSYTSNQIPNNEDNKMTNINANTNTNTNTNSNTNTANTTTTTTTTTAAAAAAATSTSNGTNRLSLDSPPNKRRLLNDSNSFSSVNTTTEDSNQNQMIPPSSSSNNSSNDTDEQQPPLPSPSASPIQSQNYEDDELLIDDNDEENWKKDAFLRIPRTEKELTSMIETLIEFLPPDSKGRNALTWKLLSQTNRTSLSILNNTMNKSLRRDLISNLPFEISSKILSFLDFKSLARCQQVSTNWFKIVNKSSNIWRDLLISDKYVKGEDEIFQELSQKQELLSHWFQKDELIQNLVDETNNGSPQDLLYKTLYKKNHLIHKRWMDPTYQPKRISIKAHGRHVITCLQFDNEKIITGADDNVINIFSTATGALKTALKGHTGGVWALKYYGNTLVSGATDRTVRIWNIKQGRCTHVFRGHTSTVRCLDILTPVAIGFSSTGEKIMFPPEPLLITGSRDNNIHVWKLPIANEDDEDNGILVDEAETENPYFIKALRGHTASVRCISGYGNIVVTGSYDMTVRVWDLMTNRCKLVLRGHADRVYSTVLDIKRNRCISGSMDSTVKIWDLETGSCMATLDGHSSLVGLLDLSDTALVSAAADSTLRIWNPDNGASRFQLKGHLGAITCFQHDDKKVVSGSERMLKLWNVTTGEFVRDLLTDVTGSIWQVRFDHRRCVAAVQHRSNDGDETVIETVIEILDFGYPLYSNTPQELEDNPVMMTNLLPGVDDDGDIELQYA